MVEELKVYLAEEQNKIAEIQNIDYAQKISEEIELYRQELIKKYELEKQQRLEKQQIRIEAIRNIIEKEQEKL